MISKENYARSIVEEYCLEAKIPESEAHLHITSSSRLAVALEYLGMLSEEEMEYSKNRAGIEKEYVCLRDGNYEKTEILTTRDMLELLPDRVDE